MQRTRIKVALEDFPARFHPFLTGDVYDSSCSGTARVWFLDAGNCYLKRMGKGLLAKEAEMTAFFHGKGLAAEVLAYESLEHDWLLTRRVPGEDCIHSMYLEDPKRLCDTTAELLRRLHEESTTGCPIHRTEEYLENAKRNYESKA